MIQKTLRIEKIFTLVFLFTLCFSTFFSSYLIGNSWERQKIINDLRTSAEKCYPFSGCRFTLFDGDVHDEYYNNLKARDLIIVPLWNKLYYELSPNSLDYFYQFKERISVMRLHGIYKKDKSDYCLLYTKEFNEKTRPWNSNQKYYDENSTECNQNYTTFCTKLNNLESQINEAFLRYYDSKNFSYYLSKQIYDHGLVHLANGNVEEAVKLADDFLKQIKEERKSLNSFSSEDLLNLSVTFLEAKEYSRAIDYLNLSLEKDPANKEAYFQRAIANLEIGIFDNAVIDFLASEKGKNFIHVKTNAPNEFREAFLKGLMEGTNDAVINFFPSLYSFAYGNVFHPIDSLTNYVNACYELMKVEAEYLKEAAQIQLDEPSYSNLSTILLKPGLKRLYAKMDELDPAEQGHLLGHTIGLYGTDFVAGVGLIKGVSNCAKLANAFKAARDAGRIYELETLAQSASISESITVQAAERIAIRETIVQGAKSGRVVIKNPNVQFHVMQEKHAWDKLIPVSGNVEEDFRKVVLLLEEHDILSQKYFLESETFSQGKVLRTDYTKMIDGYEIRAAFETYLEDNQTFLKDAWVITK